MVVEVVARVVDGGGHRMVGCRVVVSPVVGSRWRKWWVAMVYILFFLEFRIVAARDNMYLFCRVPGPKPKPNFIYVSRVSRDGHENTSRHATQSKP